MILITCNRCKVTKGKDNYYKDSSNKVGYKTICKECTLIQKKEYYKNNSEKIKKKKKEKEGPEMIEYRRAYNLKNKDKRHRDYKTNREEILAKKTEYYNANKDLKTKYNKKYYKDNIERIKIDKHKYVTSEAGRKVSLKGKHKRRALEKGNGGSYTIKQRKECINFFNNKCAYSGIDLKGVVMHLDHIRAISKNGTSYIWNMCPSSRDCNFSKHNSDMEEWYRKQDYFSEERLNKIYEWQKYAYNKFNEEVK